MRRLFYVFQIVVSLGLMVFTVSCGDKNNCEDPNNPNPCGNEEELVTTLRLTFTDSLGSLPQTFVFKDADGTGGNAPSQWDTIKLSPNRTYFVTLKLLNESVTPTDTISNEVLEEANDHLFIFKQGGGINLTTSILDKDAANLPLGLQSKWRTGAVSTGTSQVILKHQPGVKNGSEVLGTTDVDVIFQTKIQ